MRSVSYITCVVIIVSLPRWSIFFFLDVDPIIVVLPTNRPEIIFPTALTTKNLVAFALHWKKLKDS